MAEDGTFEPIQSLHRDLIVVAEALKDDREERGRFLLSQVPQNPALEVLGHVLPTCWEKPSRKQASRTAVESGKLQVADDEWSLNKDFQQIVLRVADFLELDEIEAAKITLHSEGYEAVLGRSREECAIIRYYQQRKYLLSCIRLLLELAKEEDELLAEDAAEGLGLLGQFVDDHIFRVRNTNNRFIPICMSAMQEAKAALQQLADQVTRVAMTGQSADMQFNETIDFARVSLIQQHELLAVIACFAVEKNKATESDFTDLVRQFKQADKYDFVIAHLFPLLGTYITTFGSTEGSGNVEQARKLNSIICDEDSRQMPYLNAAIRAWWIAEYSGWYMEDAPGSALPNVDLDAEDIQRSKQFVEALRDGAFDLMFALVADVMTSEWQDPARGHFRNWLIKRTPSLPQDTVPFSDFLQSRLKSKLETFIDAFISNMPDVLRKLRTEEDEQRQMRQVQEQDLDLERFLLIIAYAYEGRPEAADAFWADPESNLAGFLQWASRRASTPLVTAFCEMLQCISEDSQSATSAHTFLLDENHHAQGKMRQSLSLTWAQIFKELEFFINKIRDRPVSTPANAPRTVKFTNEQAETEPESDLMLECYLRLMSRLAANSEDAQRFLLEQPKERIVDLLFQLVSSMVSSRQRACGFKTLRSLICRRNLLDGHLMWRYLESCLSGGFMPPTLSRTPPSSNNPLPPSFYMDSLFQTMSPNFDEASAFIEFITLLVTLPEGHEPLNDVLPYPEDLGASNWMRPGIEPYLDFALGHMFAVKAPETQDITQQRILRFCCLDLAMACISSFNEDLLVFGNETNLAVDSSISTKDLATYVTLHPFNRVMEWMFDSRFMKSLLDTIHQSGPDIGKAAPDSPLILGVLRAIQLVSKVLDLQATYLDLVRPLVKPHARTHSRSPFTPNSNNAYASVEDGLLTSMTLISDLGGYCGIGHPEVTLASLRLLEQISTSPRIVAAWDMGPHGRSGRNKAIVALEDNGEADAVAGSFKAEFTTPLDFFRETESPDYMIKVYILDFIFSCLQANPDRPTIGHLLLGFHCGPSTLSIEPGSAFDQRSALFHTLLPLVLELPIRDEEGSMRHWLINLKYKVMRIFKTLWSSPLSAAIVLDELRENDFVFHLLLQGLVTQQSGLWDGQEANGPAFLCEPAAQGYVDYLAMRAMTLEYITHELCSVSRGPQPALKRRMFEALTGQINLDGGESIPVTSVFEFHDALPPKGQFDLVEPQWQYLKDFPWHACMQGDDACSVDKAREILLLMRNDGRFAGQLVSQQDLAPIEEEEELMIQYIVCWNRQIQVMSYSFRALKAWTQLLLVMTDTNDFKGTNKVSFILQTLQAILPGLEVSSTEDLNAAYQMAELARILLFKLDSSSVTGGDKESRAVESLVGDKLFQLLQICLGAIARCDGGPGLRSVYYGICYRYLTALADHSQGGGLSGHRRTAKTIQVFGDKLINVICDDAFNADPACQAAALTLLGSLVHHCSVEKDNYVVDMLNKLNFIAVLVNSLRDVMRDMIENNQSGNPDHEHHHNTKLALLLQLCQTREGAKNVLHANLFRRIEESALFSVDPELQVDTADPRALEKHYALLVKVTRILGAAILSRASHNIAQGRRFLTEHRMLVMHVLKRSAGIGGGATKTDKALMACIDELAEAFMVIITATEFLEFETESLTDDKQATPALFH